MDKELIEKYKREMLDMYRTARAIPTVTKIDNTPPPATPESYGQLIGIVTALRGIYPVPNAKVTVFTGNYNDMQIIDTAYTDQSGRTKPFILETPDKQLSLDQNNQTTPYSSYNLEVKAEGYIDNIHMNIPVFSGVTSIQRSQMILLETAGEDKSPRIYDESQRFNL